MFKIIDLSEYKWLCILFAFWMADTTAFAQNEGLSIKLEFVSVVRSLNPYYSCKGVSAEDTVSSSIHFAFIVQNYTDKEILFGTNTMGYYWKFKKYYYKGGNNGVIGRFFMLHGEDSIPLFTDYSSLILSSSGQYMTIGGHMEYSKHNKRMSVFRDLLCHFSHPGSNTKEYIYEYLRQARIVYVPVVSDYERWFNISQNDLRRNEVLYPQDTIEVYKNDPFRILFLWEDDEEYYEVYPHIDSETQIDNPDNED
ncbi:hypothetical protein [Bacteroides sp.]